MSDHRESREVLANVVTGRMVDLNGSASHERGRREAGSRLGRNRAHPSRDEASGRRARDDRPARRRGATRTSGPAGATRSGTRAGGARAGRVAEVGDEELLEQHDRSERHDRGERAVRLLELALERRAPLTGAQVAADERVRPALQAFGDLAELDPNLVA